MQVGTHQHCNGSNRNPYQSDGLMLVIAWKSNPTRFETERISRMLIACSMVTYMLIKKSRHEIDWHEIKQLRHKIDNTGHLFIKSICTDV